MSEANNAKPTAGSIRIGLIARAEELERFAGLVQREPLELVAQAGMAKPEAIPKIEWYDDTRVMIAQSGIQALVLATSVRAVVELGKAAVQRGVHVWRLPPLARNFAEATEVVAQARQQGVVYRVASWWEHVSHDVRWALRLREDFKPRFSELAVSAPGPSVKSWRASLVDAGGGVLTSDAYDQLEALVAIRQLPESGQAAIGRLRRRIGEVPRETEDVATAILRYEGDGIAIVRAAWDTPPFECGTLHHGTTATLRLTDHQVALRAIDGTTLEERGLPTEILVPDLLRFADVIRAGRNDESAAEALERHIAVTALLETLYLSARTSQPESPRKLYQVSGWPEPKP